MTNTTTRPRRLTSTTTDAAGPTVRELRSIDTEWPLIEAEIELLDAELIVLRGGDDEVARRRVRRAETVVLVRARAWIAATRPTTPTTGRVAV